MAALADFLVSERVALALGAVSNASYQKLDGLFYAGGTARLDVRTFKALTLSIAVDAGTAFAGKTLARAGPALGAYLMLGPTFR